MILWFELTDNRRSKRRTKSENISLHFNFSLNNLVRGNQERQLRTINFVNDAPDLVCFRIDFVSYVSNDLFNELIMLYMTF